MSVACVRVSAPPGISIGGLRVRQRYAAAQAKARIQHDLARVSEKLHIRREATNASCRNEVTALHLSRLHPYEACLRHMKHFAAQNMKRRLRAMKRSLDRLHVFLPFSPKKGKKNGGVDRNRTGLSDFADRCLTSWLPRLDISSWSITYHFRGGLSNSAVDFPGKNPICRLLGRGSPTFGGGSAKIPSVSSSSPRSF